MKKIVFWLIFSPVLFLACNDGGNGGKPTDNIPAASSAIPFTVVSSFPHDTGFFTEGLEFYNGQLFESSGGDEDATPYPSALGVLDMTTGKVDVKIKLDASRYFGEGITFFNDKLYMLTWTSNVGFIYDAKTFKKIGEFPLPSKEGWGMTHDSTSLIMSEGTSNLYFLSPDSLKLLRILSVTDNNGPVPNINELEYINGFIYANQWQTPYILKINPESGKVAGRLNLDTLVGEVKKIYPEARELNGIAYDAVNDKLYVTGKLWPKIYEIKIQ